ncbi:unnamed protein product [Paramecium primaurelia]|uniref:Uncharacterized protein n=1 Tax=Paramecium primaurelia TaxID=5886 RepID=A0A8S1QC38_PARPR|nr:unnamed protein product [Paramecium primaurelia]
MEYCDSCMAVLNERHLLEDQLARLQNELEIVATQLKLLREENELLKSNIKVPNKQRRKNNRTKAELEQCQKEIKKLQVIIQHKDMIIQSQLNYRYGLSEEEGESLNIKMYICHILISMLESFMEFNIWSSIFLFNSIVIMKVEFQLLQSLHAFRHLNSDLINLIKHFCFFYRNLQNVYQDIYKQLLLCNSCIAVDKKLQITQKSFRMQVPNQRRSGDSLQSKQSNNFTTQQIEYVTQDNSYSIQAKGYNIWI